MRNLNLTFLLFCFCNSLYSQNLPSESPTSTIIQKVGLSDIKLTYSRPNVNGRAIFGTLVPFGQIWRTGADYPTRITLSDTTFFQCGSHQLPPGEYAVFTIPGKDKWTIIFNSNTRLWGAYGYNEKEDVLRIEVDADTAAPFHETFTITFSDVYRDSARISLSWENTSVSFSVSVNIKQRVLDYINAQLTTDEPDNPKWRIYWVGADFLLKKDHMLDLALEWIEKSVELNEYWLNCWTGAEIHAKLGNFEEAVAMGRKAIEIGTDPQNASYFPYKQVYELQIEKWLMKL